MPIPSLPSKFAPHVQTVPSDLRMMVPRAPPQTDTTSAPGVEEINASNRNKKRTGRKWFIGGFPDHYRLICAERNQPQRDYSTGGGMVAVRKHRNLPPRRGWGNLVARVAAKI